MAKAGKAVSKPTIGDCTGGRVFEAVGVSAEFLARQAWDELHATITRTAKLKGAVQDKLPKGFRIIAETEEETIVQWEERNWGTQQAARMDCQKLLGMYPADKLELQGVLSVKVVSNVDEP